MFTARSYGARGRLLWLVPLSGLVLAGSQAIDVRRPPLANMASRPRPRPLEVGDADRDGIADGEELALAARFAPIVVLDPADRYRPASLPWLLERLPAGEVPLKQRLPQLLARARAAFPEPVRQGSRDPRDWVTYVHVFPRTDGGTNLQYWFFYPYNDRYGFFDHEGDWEHVTVHLDEQRRPRELMLAQHGNNRPGESRPWEGVRLEGEHPIVLAARGDHASYPEQASMPWFERSSGCAALAACASPIWRTWEGGGLVNIGERGALLGADGVFEYDGRWGGKGRWFAIGRAPRAPPYQRRSFQSGGFD